MTKPKGLDRPMRREEVHRIKPRAAAAPPAEGQMTRIQSTYLAFDRGAAPRVDARVEQVAAARGQSLWRLDVEVSGRRVDPKPLLPPIIRRPVSFRTARTSGGPLGLEPHRPDHLGLKAVPAKYRPPRRPKLLRRDGSRLDPLYIFDPDGRWTYHDHDWPWCCLGQVSNLSGGLASGVLIGPRHVLTASHALDWNAPWAFFTANRHGSSNQGVGQAWCVWYYEKIGGVDSENVDEDYVVLVLDKPLGLGYFGAKTYVDDWDDGHFWSHVGYPSDMQNATWPAYQDGFAMVEEDGGKMKAMSTEDGDMTYGQSGGPVFGWWDNAPYAVGVVSGQGAGMNWISGGYSMVRLIQRARLETP